MQQAAFLYSDDFVKYKFSDRHPLKQHRLTMVDALVDGYGLYSNGSAVRVAPNPIAPEFLEHIHSPDYLRALRRMSDGEHVANSSLYGLGLGDNPAFPGMWEASLLYAGATLDAANLVLDGIFKYAFNTSGGLHHAMYDHAAGFCLVNDCAVAAYAARDRGMRVAYIDIDAHHGDGTQALFYDDPNVLTVSLHETGKTLFPGTGFTREIGIGAGEGASINIPMWAGSSDAEYQLAFNEIVEPIIRAFDPGFIVLQAGGDAHFSDPLAHLMVTSRGWIEMVDRVLGFAIPTVVLGGGGYDVRTVTRLWTMVQGRLSGVELADEIPAQFVERYGYSHLHDENELVRDHRESETAARFVRHSIAEIKHLVGERYGL